MKPSSFFYLIGQGISGLWKNRMMTLASIGVLTACLLIVGFSVLLTENINKMVGFVESQNEVIAFLYNTREKENFLDQVNDVDSENNKIALRIQQDFFRSNQSEEDFIRNLIDSGMTQDELKLLFGNQSIHDFNVVEMVEQQEQVRSGYPVIYWNDLIAQTTQTLEQLSNIESVRFVSKKEALASQKKTFGELAYLLDNYAGEENPLSHSFVIKIIDLEKLEETKTQLEQVSGVKLVNASHQVATTLVNLRSVVNLVGWSIIVALSVVSLVIIVNTIRASIFSRRKELNIMKYVGATNSFIRLPFIVEGFVLGIIAASMAYLMIFAGYEMLMQTLLNDNTSWLQQAFGQTILFQEISIKLAMFFGISGIGLGIFGSVLSIRHHIKV